MATALDLIKGALRRINSYQTGETIAPPDEADCLETLNDLLDSWSIQKQLIFGSVENILQLNAQQAVYTIGNPTCTEIGEPPFTGVLTINSPIIANVTNIPNDLVVGSTLTDSGNVIPAGTTVAAIGSNFVTMSANATSTPANNPDSIIYTIPGDFAIPRPNRVTHAFTRFAQLDFTIEVTMSQTRYLEILYKAQPGPWPVVAWYNPLMPYGQISFYQTPGNAGELHLFTDTILSNLTATQTFILPPGYSRALKWCLAKEICAEYGFPMSDAIRINAADSMGVIKALNALPTEKASYDRALVSRRANAGWILSGGFE